METDGSSASASGIRVVSTGSDGVSDSAFEGVSGGPGCWRFA